MEASGARQAFIESVARPDAEINLAKAALSIAQEEYPELEVPHYLQLLDQMAAVVQGELPPERYPLRIIQTVNRYLYDQMGFVGNGQDYYDPRNSFLNQVLERRTGIPITLSLVYLEIARRIGFPMVGIGMPGHFLICPDVPEMEVLVDPFYEGQILFLEDCRDRLTQIYGRPLTLQDLPPLLPRIGPRRFLARMLTNLKSIYLNQNDVGRALAVVDRLVILLPDQATELRDRGILYYQLGEWQRAYQDLQTYLLRSPDALDTIAIQQLLDRLNQML
jgi:regulator of sirC expression with transglutaminase-like and TPR domain